MAVFCQNTGSHELVVAYACETLGCSSKGAEGSVSVYSFIELEEP